MIARRAVLTAACATALGAALALPLAAQSRGPSEVPVAELMKPVGLPDLAIGPDDAKVTVVEYASMTCGHCATFTNNVWPDFKKKYIDTGKVRYVFREFPLDNLAAAASMLARCAGNDKALPMIEVLFEKQNEWAFGEGNPVPRLFEIAKQAGFTQESFDKCLTDQKLLDDITAGRTRASEVFGVSATPTFYVNGKKLEGGNTMDKFDAAIEPLLEKN
ncbi:DsbA family protein [Hyphomicrobium sulfonivorans]|uniref:DsbA family protein n=1 Tax=Hyphomicrobium sulfonivorans TaxID=121290 RepID=UPI001570340C|nr:DsbA family protein [Hyphomicrobium sulfonivorans]MBI1648859.1 DsbA family protein [Hyphomicrobium sulfonivorans]